MNVNNIFFSMQIYVKNLIIYEVSNTYFYLPYRKIISKL